MARNGLAGTSIGKSKSARFYQNNPEAKKKKLEYDKKDQKKKYKKNGKFSMYKSNLAKANRDNPNSKPGDGKDVAHTSKGLKLKTQKANRGSNSDSAGDIRARGKKK